MNVYIHGFHGLVTFAGRGVFATAAFQPGEAILLYRGEYGHGRIPKEANNSYVYEFEHNKVMHW